MPSVSGAPAPLSAPALRGPLVSWTICVATAVPSDFRLLLHGRQEHTRLQHVSTFSAHSYGWRVYYVRRSGVGLDRLRRPPTTSCGAVICDRAQRQCATPTTLATASYLAPVSPITTGAFMTRRRPPQRQWRVSRHRLRLKDDVAHHRAYQTPWFRACTRLFTLKMRIINQLNSSGSKTTAPCTLSAPSAMSVPLPLRLPIPFANSPP